jgi:hypothetical protein
MHRRHNKAGDLLCNHRYRITVRDCPVISSEPKNCFAGLQ